MSADLLKAKIRHVPDFPKPGILFYDITTVLKDPAAYRESIRLMLEPYRGEQLDIVEKRFGRHFGTDFGNPDFVRLAESFGLPAWRCESVEDYQRRLAHALTLDVPSALVLPIDYSIDVAISEELGSETVAT